MCDDPDEAKMRQRFEDAVRGIGERVNAPGNVYHGLIKLDHGVYLDPALRMPVFNAPEILAAVDLPVTPENVALLTAHLQETAKKMEFPPEVVVQHTREEFDAVRRNH